MPKKPAKPLWGKFADEMLEGSREKAFGIMQKMSGVEREDAERWYYGKKSRNTLESFEKWIDSVTDADINTHCQFDGLPEVGKGK